MNTIFHKSPKDSHMNNPVRAKRSSGVVMISISLILFALVALISCGESSSLEQGFINPPNSARPGVFWIFMDGNRSREAMTKDLESMKEAGIGLVL